MFVLSVGVFTCVEINQCVGCMVRKRHRHAIEQASRRWRGGRIFDFRTGIKTDDATAQATFAAADTDSSGDVSFEEFARFVKNGDGDASKAFKRGLLGVA